ncbi:efflux RND transporter periplasmic adaptor subunit [Paenibacillus sp. y28]|uniref:efflux RND transporter periplasmic adaptor subunit n=1 Tax=Paenibacillus sp. y28 TaxID=3129110 RepID=UPI00301B3575
MRIKKVVLFLTIAIVVIGISAVLYIQNGRAVIPPGPSGMSAMAQTLKFPVTREDIGSSIDVKGKSAYVQETVVQAPYSASVLSWNAKEGTQVNKGDILFEMDTKALQNEITQQELAIRRQELEMKIKKSQQAQEDKTASETVTSQADAFKRYTSSEQAKLQDELDRLTMEAAKTQLQDKKEKIGQAKVTAEISGIYLSTLEADKKNPPSLSEYQTVGKIVDMSQLQLVTSVGEYEVFRITPGMPVAIRSDSLKGSKLSGQVLSVSRFAKGSASGTATGAAQFEVIISLENSEQFIAGMDLTGTIQIESKAGAIVVPTLTVMRDKDEYYVFVETPDGGAERRTITIGLETADKTEVLSGLTEGETVVLQ